MASLKIFLKYGKNILKNKNIPKHDEPLDAFKNIFCILINKKKCKSYFLCTVAFCTIRTLPVEIITVCATAVIVIAIFEF